MSVTKQNANTKIKLADSQLRKLNKCLSVLTMDKVINVIFKKELCDSGCLINIMFQSGDALKVCVDQRVVENLMEGNLPFSNKNYSMCRIEKEMYSTHLLLDGITKEILSYEDITFKNLID